MGLLTDPRAGNGEIINFVMRWEKPLCFFMWTAGVLWVMSLSHSQFNDATYISENALLPGLVTNEFNEDSIARQFHDELLTEMKRYPNGVPYAWLCAKFHQLHLDVYTHNFTLNYPFRQQQFTGQNVYGIVRAPRGASTEAIVLSVPYRPTNSVHLDTTPSIAVLLAFAKFARRQKYWAKDIIFLVTEHEQLGMQAWLEAYHRVSCGQEGVLIAGDLSGRAGSIQAAINLELHSMKIASIDVKIEGLNGQLPNLDLVNLAYKLCGEGSVRKTFQRRRDTIQKDKLQKWWYQFNTMMSMVTTQATGVPTGNHGLFHRFGIEAITLEGFGKSGQGLEASLYQVGHVVESIVRSLNNLLERFHQSFFFYLLPSTNRYISIGLYMPPLALIVGGLFIKAFSLWLKLQDSTIKNESKKDDKVEQIESEELDLGGIALEVLWTHIFGVAIMSSPRLFTDIGSRIWDLPTEDSIYFGFVVITVSTFLWTLLFQRSRTFDNASLLCTIALVELATMLLCIAMHNFSLALLAAIVYVPAAQLISPKKASGSRYRDILHVPWVLVHPFIVASAVVTGYTYCNFSEEPTYSILTRALQATKTAFVYSTVDSMIYGNWLFNVVVAILIPNWLLFWTVVTSRAAKQS